MARYFTADLHLGETRLELMQRPFRNDLENDQAIISNFRRVLTDDDELIIVGDAVSKSAHNPINSLRQLDFIPGKKFLIRGNHDEQFTDEQLVPYFEDVYAHGDGIELTVSDIPCYVTHYPTRGKKDKFNLVGHIHSAWKVQLNMINLGVDVHNFRPVSEHHIGFLYKAICEFYDNDVFVGNSFANLTHAASRGKKTSYFDSI